jgi:heme-degrading monooxygenase HmoA
MICRMWRGAVRKADSDAYADYINATGTAEYEATPGNRGVWMLRRDKGDLVEFVMVTHWDSIEAIKAFAGEDHERAVYYPEDDRYLVEHDDVVSHFEIVR